MFYRFGDYLPVCAESSFVHPQAAVIGNVIIGEHCYIGPGATVRGDWGEVVLEDGCNVQEGCCVHMFPGVQVRLRQNAHIGHGAIIHGADIGKDVMVGMNAVIMDKVAVGEGSIVGALTFVKTGFVIPPKSLVVGNPARIIGEVDDRRAAWKRAGTELYQTLPAAWQDAAAPVEPLRQVPHGRPKMSSSYAPFEKLKRDTSDS